MIYSAPLISRPQRITYGVLALPLAFAGMPLYIHAPDFYSLNQGLGLAEIGVVLLAVRIFDAVQDPVIGIISDRYASYRMPIMIAFIAALAAGFYMLFHPPQPATLAWFATSVLLTTTAFSVLTINYTAAGGLWTQDKQEQTRITTTREAIGLIGLMLASIAPSVLQLGMEAATAFHYMTLILIGVMAAAGIIFIRWMQRFQPVLTRQEKNPALRSLWQCLKQQRLFYGIYAINVIATSIPAVLVLFFIRDRLGAESYSGMFLLLYFIAGVVGMPLWQKIAARYGKPQCWLAAMLLAIISFLWATFLSTGDLVGYGFVCVASGLALGAELALPPSILAEGIHRTGSESHATAQFSVLAFLSKLGLALAAGICLPLLQAAGYQPGGTNSEGVLQSLGFIYAALPCILKIIAAALLWYFMTQQTKGFLNEETAAGRMPDRSGNAVV